MPTKVRLVKATVVPVVMYGCESWTVKKAECRRIDAFELWCWRRLLRVPWTVTRQAPLSMEASRQEYWSGCHFLLQELFPTQGSNPGLLYCRQAPTLQVDSLPTEPPGKPPSACWSPGSSSGVWKQHILSGRHSSCSPLAGYSCGRMRVWYCQILHFSVDVEIWILYEVFQSGN